MTGWERQQRYLAKRNARLAAENPPEPWMASLPGPEFFSDVPTMEELMAMVAGDPRMAAEVQAELDASVAEIEEADGQ